MDTNWLADLEALAATLNFSRAAESRNITQPAFGRRIKALEAWCGAELVDRSTHRLQLTAAGRAMLEAANDVNRRLERVRREIEASAATTAVLTFAATHALSFSFFPAWMQTLGADASTLPMRLLSDNMNQCERLMLAGDAQFLLCHFRAGSPTTLTDDAFRHVTLARDRLIPVSRRDGEGRALHRLPGTGACSVPLIAFEESSGMGRILSSALADSRAPLNSKQVLSSHLAMVLKALAIEGKGVAWIPESLVTDELAPQGRLARAGTAEWSVDVEIVLVRKRARMPDLAERFWELVRAR
jgi:LysR family transcriptional regulator, hypochlorite-specific transcription factor HypT